jgi:cysteine desulfurase/selenocysteine lyase
MDVIADIAETGERSAAARGLDIARVRHDFPILSRKVHGRPLVFLDSGASAQKPRQVIDAVAHCYAHEYANVHRGVYYLSERATAAFEESRRKVGRFLNAPDEREIVFTRGATEAINLVASSYGARFLKEGDEIILSVLEHHSNIVPWQLLRERTGAVLRVVPIDDRGELDFDAYEKLLGPRTKIVALTHASNALGTILPVKAVIERAHAVGAVVLLDGCQAVPHVDVDVQDLDCDFYVFSGHKLYGPSGIGVLYGKAHHLEAMPPYQGGGDMIRRVTFEKTEYAEIPSKFEAGTPNIAGAIGLGAAIDYVTALGIDPIERHEQKLLSHALDRLSSVEGVRLLGQAKERASIVSFLVGGIHSHDVGTILDQAGIAVRVGHHCAQPLMDHFGITGTVRASFGLYNSTEDADALVAGLEDVRKIFG